MAAPFDTTSPGLFWSVEMALLTNRFFLYDMAKVVGWAGLAIAVLLAAIMGFTGSLRHVPPVLGVFALVLLGLAALVLVIARVFFGNRLPMRFSVSPAGVGWEMLSRRARAGNRAAVVAGALALSAGTAGAGLLAMAGESDLRGWHDFASVRKHPEHCVISLRNGWRVVVRLYCTPDNYRWVEQFVDGRLGK